MVMDSQKKMGKNIKKVRRELGLKQSEVAEKAGLSANYYSRIERGEVNPSNKKIEAICKVLKIKSSDILPY